MVASPLEHLADTHPDLEIWWDSSPLVYHQSVEKMLACSLREGPLVVGKRRLVVEH